MPDPIPFESKLRGMLEEHAAFVLTKEQHDVAHGVLVEVTAFSAVNEESMGKRLDTEQEREQEQEQHRNARMNARLVVQALRDLRARRSILTPQDVTLVNPASARARCRTRSM